MALTIADVKKLFPLSVEDPEIQPHLDRATRDYKDVAFEDDLQEREVVGSKTIYYVAPLLWKDIQVRVEEYAESLGSFKDIASFQKIWLERAESAMTKVNVEDEDGIVWTAI